MPFFSIPQYSSRKIWHLKAAILALHLLLLSVSVAPAIAATQTTDNKNEITLLMSITPLSSPFVVALEKGYFADYGLAVNVKEIIGGYRAADALFRGEGDIATVSETVLMFNSFQHTDFSTFCTFVTSTKDSKLITRNDTGIRSVADLVGKRVGTATSASTHFFLDELLIFNGIDNKQVEVVHVNPESASKALTEKSVDAIVVWEPWAYLSIRALGDKAVLVPHDHMYIKSFNALTTNAFAQAHPDLLKKVLQGLLRAVKFIREHPQATQQIVARRFNKDPAIIEAIWENFEFDISLSQWLITTLEAEARWAMRRKLVKSSLLPNYRDFLLVSPLQDIAEDKVNLF